MESWRPLALHPPQAQPPMSRGRAAGAPVGASEEAGVFMAYEEAAHKAGASSSAASAGENVLGFAVPSVTCFFPSESFDVYDAGGIARFSVAPPRSRDERQRGVVLEIRRGAGSGGGERIAVLREEFGWCRSVQHSARVIVLRRGPVFAEDICARCPLCVWRRAADINVARATTLLASEAPWVVDGGSALREQRLLLRARGGPCCLPRCFAMGVGALGQCSAGAAHALRGPPFPAPRHAAVDKKALTAGARAAREGAMRSKEAIAAAAARDGLYDPVSPDATWKGRACCCMGGEYAFAATGERMGALEPASGACGACAGQHVAYRLRVARGADEATVLMLAMAQLHQEHRLCGAEGMANFNGHRVYGMR